ncbi:N-acetyltransferase family protein [Roseateles chitinivorans]|uniref:GNAT family N-acetyltransferase n=1 Tax=Roseateles chitinivorans TaxID=2917965 RepID=UPI003D677055
MSIALRPAIDEDASDVATVLMASRKAYLPFAPMAHTESEVRGWVRDVLVPSGDVTVACEDGRIVGVLATSRGDDAAWIEQLYLMPGWTGQGIGARLLVHALAILPRPVRLYTFQANAGARAFYERHGFEVLAYSDGQENEERCPDVLYELSGEPGADQGIDRPGRPA